MLLPLLPGLSFSGPEPESWWNRIRENLSQLIAPAVLSRNSANGAPLHLLRPDRTSSASRAQSISAATHVCILALLVLLATHPLLTSPPSPFSSPRTGTLTLPAGFLRTLGDHPSTGSGSGGDQNPVPATHGNLPAVSSIPLVKPSLPRNENSALPVPPALLDTNAPPVLISIDNVGLPWMAETTNSGGPGKGHTIGSADGDTTGDSGNRQAGFGGSDGTYHPGMVMPTCVYCPLPAYSDEARKVKMEGTVTMRVLVGPDGRASDIRVVRGVGYGLDERAVQTVRGWKFTPARDGSHGVVAAWITIEAVFRLF